MPGICTKHSSCFITIPKPSSPITKRVAQVVARLTVPQYLVRYMMRELHRGGVEPMPGKSEEQRSKEMQANVAMKSNIEVCATLSCIKHYNKTCMPYKRKDV